MALGTAVAGASHSSSRPTAFTWSSAATDGSELVLHPPEGLSSPRAHPHRHAAAGGVRRGHPRLPALAAADGAGRRDAADARRRAGHRSRRGHRAGRRHGRRRAARRASRRRVGLRGRCGATGSSTACASASPAPTRASRCASAARSRPRSAPPSTRGWPASTPRSSHGPWTRTVLELIAARPGGARRRTSRLARAGDAALQDRRAQAQGAGPDGEPARSATGSRRAAGRTSRRRRRRRIGQHPHGLRRRARPQRLAGAGQHAVGRCGG